MVIYRHREKYSVSEMCRFFEVFRSGYYDYVKRMDKPDRKWATDISYIKTGQGFLYLSIIRDLYDNSIAAIGQEPNRTTGLCRVLCGMPWKKRRSPLRHIPDLPVSPSPHSVFCGCDSILPPVLRCMFHGFPCYGTVHG